MSVLIPFRGEKPQVHPSAWVAPTSVLVGRVIVEAGATVMFNCVIRADNNTISIGAEANVQDGTIIHCDTPQLPLGKPVTVGARSSIGHGARLHGCCIGEGTVVGIGAIVLDGAVIGPRCLVAAGAVVVPGSHVPAGQLVVGQPAVAKRPLRDQDFELLKTAAMTYMELRELYRDWSVSSAAKPLEA